MALIVTNRQLLEQLLLLQAKMDVIMSTQDEINAAAQEIETDVAAENTATQAIQAAPPPSA